MCGYKSLLTLISIQGRILVDCLIRTEKGCTIWLCVDSETEEGMTRVYCTINLGFTGRVQFQAAGRGPGRS